MVLEQLIDGASGHLSALRDEDTRNLVFILCLPFVDGIFATLLVSGAIQTFSDVIAIALTIFTGAGALSVLYSSADTKEEAKEMVLGAAPFLITGAAVISLIAPVFEQILYVERMKYAAALALLTISLKMMEVDLADKLSVPAIVLTGVVLSVKQPENLYLTYEYMAQGVLTVSVSLVGLYLASLLDPEFLDLSYIQKGGALVLAIISLSMFGVQLPDNLGLTVFAVSLLASLRG